MIPDCFRVVYSSWADIPSWFKVYYSGNARSLGAYELCAGITKGVDGAPFDAQYCALKYIAVNPVRRKTKLFVRYFQHTNCGTVKCHIKKKIKGKSILEVPDTGTSQYW